MNTASSSWSVFARQAVTLLFLATFETNLLSQTATSEISGQVTDQSGAAIVHANVSAVNTATQVEKKVVSNEDGYYTIPFLPPGSYQLTVQMPGFETIVQSGLQLDVNQILTRNISLQVGQVKSQVQVEASAQALDTGSAALGTAITERAVNDLPLNGRSFTQLLTLTPGATPISTAQSSTIGTNDGNPVAIPGSAYVQPALNGQENRMTIYFLDGIINTDFRTTVYTVLPIIDAVQEFRVQTHNDDVEAGGAIGGVVNLISKSGTNDLHGSAWEFVRNNDFDARNAFSDATTKGPAPFRQNQFGVAVGGPVWIPKLYNGRNRTFFFFAYEGWRYGSASQVFETVPTPQELQGNFANSILPQQIYNPFTTAPDPNNPGQYTRVPFAGNIIPSSLLNPAMVSYFQTYWDKPNLTGNPVFNAINTSPVTNNSDSYQGRIDETLGSKDSLWFRYSAQNVTQDNPTTLSVNNFNQMNAKDTGGGWIHTFSPNLVVDIRGGYANRPFLFSSEPKAGLSAMQSAGFINLNTLGPVDITLDSPWGDAGISNAQVRGNPNYSITGNVTWIKGAHHWKFGFQWLNQKRLQIASGQGYQFANTQTANPENQGTTGNSLASALLGLPSLGDVSENNNLDFWIPTWGAYAMDSWKISPRVTLNLGLRYDHTNQASVNQGSPEDFDFATGQWLIGGGQLPPACSTKGIAPCIPGNGTLTDSNIPFGDHIAVSPNPVIGPNPVWTNWGPRIGVAWQVNERTVVRAGYGLYYNTLSGNSQTFQNPVNTWPDAGQVRDNLNSIGTPNASILSVQSQLGQPLPSPTPWTTSTWFYDPNLKNPLSHQWNVEIQRTMGSNLIASVAYVGSVSRRLDYNGTANVATQPGSPTEAAAEALVPYPYMTQFPYDTSTGSSSYNSLQARLQRQFAAGLQFLLSYTWSKSIDTSSGLYQAENGPGGSSVVQNYYVPNSNRGLSAFDVPQFLSLTALYELPFGRGKQWLNHGAPSYLLGNWQVNTLFQFRSGEPFTLQVLGDVANILNEATDYARPNLIGNPYLSNATAAEWFNTAAFAIPYLSYGNFGRDVLRSAHVFDTDFSLFKSFPIGEKRSVEIRFEGFNVFNIANLGVPGVVVGQAGFGVVSSLATNPRQIQLGAKVLF